MLIISTYIIMSFNVCLTFAYKSPLLKNVTLKEKQIEALKSIYEGYNTLCIFPTGYGKSFIFQILPWFLQKKCESNEPKITVIISPLNSLMKDQIISLRRRKIDACAIDMAGSHGYTFYDDENEIDVESSSFESDVEFDEISSGKYFLIYAHPETLLNPKVYKLFQSEIFQQRLGAIVCDEAHVLLEWGSSFRPAYSR